MKKLYCISYKKCRDFEKPKIWYLLEKTLVISIIWSQCKNEDKKMFKEEESIEILEFRGLINDIEECH